jgi:hypothetical protein
VGLLPRDPIGYIRPASLDKFFSHGGSRTMPLQVGDWVRTEEGEVGQVVHIERMTAFVRLKTQTKDQTVVGYLASKLTRIDKPDV